MCYSYPLSSMPPVYDQPQRRFKKNYKKYKHIHLLLIYKIVIIEDFYCDYTSYFAYHYKILSNMFRVIKPIPFNFLMAIQLLSRRLFLTSSTMINIKTKFDNFAFLCFPGNTKTICFRHRTIACSCSYISEIPILIVKSGDRSAPVTHNPNYFVGYFLNKITLTHFPQQVTPMLKLLFKFLHCMQSLVLFLLSIEILVSLLLYFQILWNLFLAKYLSRLSKNIEKKHFEKVNFILLFFHVIVVRIRINKFKQYVVPCGKVLIDSAHFFKSNFLNP